MDLKNFREQVMRYKAEGKRMFATSSFQSQSVVFLHLLSRVDHTIPVYFLNTGFLFPETLTFKDRIAGMFGLKVTGLRSTTPKIQQKDSSNRFLYTSDPDYCCYLNKIQPLEPILATHDIWINGIRADQNDTRAKLHIEEKATDSTTRFHPMLDWDRKQILDYIKKHELPRHPLEDKGYGSIGCEPCTRKLDPEIELDPRYARWFGLNKTECGLHTELIRK